MATGDTVYVAGLPPDVTEQELAQSFGQIGAVKTDVQTGLPAIWIYKDSHTGMPKGDAVVSFEDPYAASSAIQCFHQMPMRGSIMHVSLTTTVDSGAYVQQGMQGQGMGQTHPDMSYYDPSSQVYMQPGYSPAVPSFTADNVQQPPKESDGSWGEEKPAGDGQSQSGSSATRGRGRKITAAPQGPARLFGPDDWPCPSCGNTNWARRPRCNLCGAPKPGTLDMKREGQGGGFKELDEEAIEDARRRRKALEDADDGELYDDYGRIKKKYRNIVDKATREEAALARLRGHYDPSPSGQELTAFLKEEGLVEDDEAKEEQAEADKATAEPAVKNDSPALSGEGKEKEQGKSKGAETVPQRERGEVQRHRYRPDSETIHSRRDARQRSISPRNRSRRHHSPYRERESYRSSRSSYRRSSNREDRYRHRR